MHTNDFIQPNTIFLTVLGTDMFSFRVYKKKGTMTKSLFRLATNRNHTAWVLLWHHTKDSWEGGLLGIPKSNTEQILCNLTQKIINMRAGNKTCLHCRYFGSLFSNLFRINQIKLHCCPTTIQYSRCLEWECLTSWNELLFPADKSVIKHRAAPASTSRSRLNLWPPMAGREVPLTF